MQHRTGWGLGLGVTLLIGACSSRDSSSLGTRAISDPKTEPAAQDAPGTDPLAASPSFAAAEPTEGSGPTQGSPLAVPLPPPAAPSCSRAAEFMPLGPVPYYYNNVWQAIGPASSYLVWSHEWSGNDVRVQSFHWSPEAGVTAIDELDDEVDSLPEGAVDVDQHVTQVSSDGSTVLGTRIEADTYVGAFRWSISGQQRLLDFRPTALSRDGAVAAGVREEGFVRWTEEAGTERLADSPAPTSSSPLLVSVNGEVIAGNGGAGQAFRWTEATGTTELAKLTSASTATRVQFMNDSGDLLLGIDDDAATGQVHLVRWTSAGGVQDLAAFPLGEVSLAQVSANAAVVVADVRLQGTGATHTFRWSEAEGLRDLTPLAQVSHAVYVSQSGDVVVGRFEDGSGSANGFRWSETTGTQNLASYVTPNGVGAGGNLIIDNGPSGPRLLALGEPSARGPLFERVPAGFVPAGWSEARLEGISDDGGLLVGSALNPQGERESWLLHAPQRCEP